MLPELAEAQQRMKDGRPQAALDALAPLMARQPRHPNANMIAARALHRLGRTGEALAHLRVCAQLVDGMPNPVAARIAVARAFSAMGAPEEAEALLRDALAREPRSVEAMVRLGDLLRGGGRHEEALGLYRDALGLVPDSGSLWASAGVAAHGAGALDEAVPAYERALALEPGETYVYSNLLAALLELGRPDDALAHAERWVRQAPGDIEAMAFHALLLVETGRMDEAAPLIDFDRLVRTHAINTPAGFSGLDAFNRALEAHILAHPALATPPEDHPTWHHPALRIASGLNRGESGPVALLEDAMHEAVERYFAETGEADGHPFLRHRPKDYEIHAWAAVLDGEGNQHPHIHMDGYLSGCYYVTIPDEISAPENGAGGGVVQGGFEVGRPPRELRIGADFPTRTVKPHEGLMVLFPAYLYHGTIPFQSGGRRICIAFDVMPAGRGEMHAREAAS